MGYRRALAKTGEWRRRALNVLAYAAGHLAGQSVSYILDNLDRATW